jgi:hypothetical protein
MSRRYATGSWIMRRIIGDDRLSSRKDCAIEGLYLVEPRAAIHQLALKTLADLIRPRDVSHSERQDVGRAI